MPQQKHCSIQLPRRRNGAAKICRSRKTDRPGSNAFWSNNFITEVNIPKNVSLIGSGAFFGTALENAYFESTEDWKYEYRYTDNKKWYTTSTTAINKSTVSEPAAAAEMLLNESYSTHYQSAWYRTYFK